MVEHDEQSKTPDSASTDLEADQDPVSSDQSRNQEAIRADQPADPFAALKAERDEIEARLLRVSADYQNFVRRSMQNTEDARQQQLLQMTKALLTPLDHFDHALAVDSANTSCKSLLQGVGMVRDELAKVLEQFGIKRLEVSVGDVFDPMCHEAIQRMAVEAVDSGAVAEQVQPGYLLGDKTIRPAKVVVAE